MKQIEPISIWDNGKTKTAIILNAYAVNLQLGNSATFYYSLMSEDNTQLAQGNLTISGEDYQLWEQDEFVWEWVATQLNITIIGDYVPPTVDVVE